MENKYLKKSQKHIANFFEHIGNRAIKDYEEHIEAIKAVQYGMKFIKPQDIILKGEDLYIKIRCYDDDKCKDIEKTLNFENDYDYSFNCFYEENYPYYDMKREVMYIVKMTSKDKSIIHILKYNHRIDKVIDGNYDYADKVYKIVDNVFSNIYKPLYTYSDAINNRVKTLQEQMQKYEETIQKLNDEINVIKNIEI